jgi:hypothetical protein
MQCGEGEEVWTAEQAQCVHREAGAGSPAYSAHTLLTLYLALLHSVHTLFTLCSHSTHQHVLMEAADVGAAVREQSLQCGVKCMELGVKGLLWLVRFLERS